MPMHHGSRRNQRMCTIRKLACNGRARFLPVFITRDVTRFTLRGCAVLPLKLGGQKLSRWKRFAKFPCGLLSLLETRVVVYRLTPSTRPPGASQYH